MDRANECMRYAQDYFENFGITIQYSEALTVVHEMGHWFGIGDHYGGRTPSTEEKNLPYGESGPYCVDCVYGEYRNDDPTLSTLTLCNGCYAEFMQGVSHFVFQ